MIVFVTIIYTDLHHILNSIICKTKTNYENASAKPVTKMQPNITSYRSCQRREQIHIPDKPYKWQTISTTSTKSKGQEFVVITKLSPPPPPTRWCHFFLSLSGKSSLVSDCGLTKHRGAAEHQQNNQTNDCHYFQKLKSKPRTNLSGQNMNICFTFRRSLCSSSKTSFHVSMDITYSKMFVCKVQKKQKQNVSHSGVNNTITLYSVSNTVTTTLSLYVLSSICRDLPF